MKTTTEQFENLMKAQAIVAKARYEVAKQYGVDNPAWNKLFRVGAYIAKQSEAVFPSDPEKAVSA